MHIILNIQLQFPYPKKKSSDFLYEFKRNIFGDFVCRFSWSRGIALWYYPAGRNKKKNLTNTVMKTRLHP